LPNPLSLEILHQLKTKPMYNKFHKIRENQLMKLQQICHKIEPT